VWEEYMHGVTFGIQVPIAIISSCDHHKDSMSERKKKR
jgi:hypothetical protein